MLDAPHEWVRAMTELILADRGAVADARDGAKRNPATLSFVQG